MLEGKQRKRTPHTLLMVLQVGTVTMEYGFNCRLALHPFVGLGPDSWVIQAQLSSRQLSVIQ